MKSKFFLFLGLVMIMSCKDSSDKEISAPIQTQEERVVKKEESPKEKKIDLNQFYKRRMSRKGDTLLPRIPQDSVEVFFTRYGKQHPETMVRMSTEYGDIDIELFKETPLYRASFLFLIKNGYFDETVCHRTVEDFVVQAGNSDNRITSQKRNSAGNYQLPMHILPGVKHARGTVSSSKYWENNPENWHNPFDFFISLRATKHLNGEHTIFGKVVRGMDVAQKISQVKTDSRDWPIDDIYIKMSVVR